MGGRMGRVGRVTVAMRRVKRRGCQVMNRTL